MTTTKLQTEMNSIFLSLYFPLRGIKFYDRFQCTILKVDNICSNLITKRTNEK